MNRIIIVGIIGAVLSGGVYFAYQSAGPEVPVVAAEITSDRAGIRKPPAEVPTLATYSETTSPPPASVPPVMSQSPASESAAKQRTLDAIQLAAVSYDPAELPRIQPFLTHPDPEIRAAALNGVIVLGHAAGAPLLQEAAKHATNPHEAAELLKKAEYMELPSAPIELLRERLKKRTSKAESGAAAKSP